MKPQSKNLINMILQQKKSILMILGGSAVIGLFGYLYYTYNNDDEIDQSLDSCINKIKETRIQQEYSAQNQLMLFKNSIDLQNPSLEQLKSCIRLCFEITKKEIHKLQLILRKARREINRKQNPKKYFNTIVVSQVKMSRVSSQMWKALINEIGIDTQSLAQYQEQIGPYIMLQQAQLLQTNKQNSLDQVKRLITIQLNFLKLHGQRLVDQIIINCRDWQIQLRELIPKIFEVYMIDEINLQYPDFEEEDIVEGPNKYQEYLEKENQEMKNVMQPLIVRLCTKVGLYGQQALTEASQSNIDNANFDEEPMNDFMRINNF